MGKKYTDGKEVETGSLDGGNVEAEAQLLSSSTVASRWNNRGARSFCCVTLADICCFLALLLVILCTGYMLHRLWIVKSEVDEMYPAVSRLSADILRLRKEADALQAENSALIVASSAHIGLGGSDYVDDNGERGFDLAMEDTKQSILRSLAKDTQLTEDIALQSIDSATSSQNNEVKAAEEELDKILSQATKQLDISTTGILPPVEPDINGSDPHTVAFLNALTVQAVLDDEDDDDDDIEETDVLSRGAEMTEQDASFEGKATEEADSGNSSDDDN